MEGSLFDLLGAWRVPRVVNHLALLGTAAGRLWRHEDGLLLPGGEDGFQVQQARKWQ